MKCALFVALALSGCGVAEEPFRLVAVSPTAGQVLHLNEPIVWEFDRPVDRTSVNPQSIRIQSDRVVPGTFRVRGTRVEFVPMPGDGKAAAGWPVGGDVAITLVGYPARDGLWASDREPFAGSATTTWRVTTATAGPSAFIDVDPSRPLTLRGADGARSVLVRDDGWVRLEFSEPLAPGSVVPESFPLEFDDAARTRVDVELRFEQRPFSAIVDVRPRAGFSPASTRFVLELGALGVRDLVGGSCRATATWTMVASPDAPLIAGVGDDARSSP